MHPGTCRNRSKREKNIGRIPARFLALSSILCAFAIGGTLGGHSSAESAVMGQGQSTPTTKSKPHSKGPFVLILVVDAARFDEVQLDKMPNLATLVASGAMYTRAWVGQLPSLTETSHATIGTGVLPARHLVIGDTWRVPGTNKMAPDLLSRQLDATGYIGNFIRHTGVPTLAGFIHQRFPGSLAVALSGHKIYAADGLGAGAADFVAYGAQNGRGHFVPYFIPGHEPASSILQSPQLDLPSYPRQPGLEDWWTTTLAEKFLFKYHPRLMMVNFPEVDVAGHAAGTNQTVIQPLMSNVDKQIGRLMAAYGRAGMLDQTYFIVTSDHAMIPAVHTVQKSTVDAIVAKAGGTSLYVGHGDYCAIWLKDLASVPRVANSLASANVPNVAAVYYKNPAGQYTLRSSASRLADSSVRQSYSDLLGSFTSAESPDIVLLYDEDTITMNPTFLKVGRKGDHGGATWGAQHIPVIIAGPSIKQSYSSDYPARLVDIAPTVETLLGIVPQRQDGVPLADAMISPPSWAVRAQDKVTARLTLDVQALEQEAIRRPNAH
jgi:arylsulfatase A-like enzyme